MRSYVGDCLTSVSNSPESWKLGSVSPFCVDLIPLNGGGGLEGGGGRSVVEGGYVLSHH